ncbi:unnamed protein product [Paramecium octaurelia]|uniref:RING-type domain-containing protein n=1 Tax=Paramecium octaurelia TaxID=43137 RepID=A0A8S1U4R8_PAROT|nr:unnamed protein product [Paramecium octaurelia]
MAKQLPNSSRDRMTLIDLLFDECYQKQKTLPQNVPKINMKSNLKKSAPIIQSLEYKIQPKESSIKQKDKASNVYSINELIIQNPQKQQWEYQQVQNSQTKLLELLKPINFKKQKKKENFRLHNSENCSINSYKLPNVSSRYINQNVSNSNSYRIQVRQSVQDIIKCKICFTYIDYDNYKLNCKHSYHKDCLREQLQQQINQGQYYLNCISCNERIKNNVLRNILNRSIIELYFLNQIKFIVQRYHNTVKFEKCKKCFFFWIRTPLANNLESYCQICDSNNCQ